MPQEQYVVASNTKVYLLPMLQVCCDSGFILLVKKEVLFIRVLESCLRSPHPTSSVFYWSSPPAFPFSLPSIISHIAWSSAPALLFWRSAAVTYPNSNMLSWSELLGIYTIFHKYLFSWILFFFPLQKCCGRCANVDSPGGIKCSLKHTKNDRDKSSYIGS